jgi:predicted RNA-binding protein with PIN domain
MLTGYIKRKPHDITVVFDGWKSGESSESRYMTGGVEVIYSRLGEKADSVIKRIIRESRRQVIAVSSDREITSYAWSHGSVPVSPDELLDAMERKHSSKDEGGLIYEDEEYYEHKKKGSSRTPSKKEKALRRAISKL